MSDAADRTLPATSRRRQRARQEGMLPPASLPAWGVGTAVTLLLVPAWWRTTMTAAVTVVRDACSSANPGVVQESLLWNVLGVMLPTCAVVLAAAAAATAVRLSIDGFRWHPAALIPDLRRIDPLSGIRRILSLTTLSTAAAGSVWLAILVWVATRSGDRLSRVVVSTTEALRPDAPMAETIGLAAEAVPDSSALLVPAAIAAIAVAVLRWGVLRWYGERRIRMTPEELREELRSLEASSPVRRARRKAPPLNGSTPTLSRSHSSPPRPPSVPSSRSRSSPPAPDAVSSTATRPRRSSNSPRHGVCRTKAFRPPINKTSPAPKCCSRGR
jgi:flagellar biosynthetic protein FlhB